MLEVTITCAASVSTVYCCTGSYFQWKRQKIIGCKIDILRWASFIYWINSSGISLARLKQQRLFQELVKKSILVIFLNFVIVDRKASSTLENVLEFATGASHEPPMGFDPPAILRFWPDVRAKSATFPTPTAFSYLFLRTG